MKTDADLEELCREARKFEAPSREDYEAVRRGLELQLGISAALATTAGSAKASALLGSGATKASLATLIVSWGVGGAALGGVTAWALERTLAPAPVPSAATSRPASHGVPKQKASPKNTEASASSDVEGQRADALEAASAPGERSPRIVKPAAERDTALKTDDASTASAPRWTPPGLEEEARALAEVQRALRDADPERALALLDRMEGRFGDGALGTERQAARVLALCGLGHSEKGRALAEHFISTHPTSPLIGRIRAACR